jgi:menaquinone reductase, integral membrane subunit
VILLGLVPALLLIRGKLAAAVLACAGIVLNRFVMTIQTLALPTLPFDTFLSYWPSWQENATFLGVVAYGVIVHSISYRYFVLFPQEKELSRS